MILYYHFFLYIVIEQMKLKQAGAELGQAQLPTGIWLYCDYHLLPYIDLSEMTRLIVLAK